MPIDPREALRDELCRRHLRFDRWAKFFSAVHHGSLFLSVALSATAAYVAKLKSVGSQDSADLSAGLAAGAAALTSLALPGGFSRKWRRHRTSRIAVEALLLRLDAPSADIEALRQELLVLMGEHNDGIMGPGK